MFRCNVSLAESILPLRLKLNIMNLNYVVKGKGEPLIFLHGLSDDLKFWEVLTSTLNEKYQVIRMDLRGHGESELGDDEISIATYAGDLKNLLDDLQIDAGNLVGFSLGGVVALDFAIRYPDYVSSIVLMSTFAKCDENIILTLNEFKSELDKGYDEFYDYMIPKVLCPDVIDKNREELEMLKQISSQNANVDAYKKAVDACLNFNVENELGQIEVPALVFAGKYDEIFSVDVQENLHRRINKSKFIVLDDVRHNLLVGINNAKISAMMDDFYKNEINI